MSRPLPVFVLLVPAQAYLPPEADVLGTGVTIPLPGPGRVSLFEVRRSR